MITSCGEALQQQLFAHVLHVLAGRAVDHAAVKGTILQNGLERLKPLFRPQHLEIEVRAIEARDRELRGTQTQQTANIVPHALGSGSGKRADRRPFGQRVHEIRNLEVIGAEILSPLADAMSLIHGDERNGRVSGEAHEARGIEAFRGHIDDLIHALPRIIQRAIHLPGRQRAIEVSRAHAAGDQRRDLILHQ